MASLLILGRGQYSYVVQEIAKDFFDKIDFLDDNAENGVVGKIQEYAKFKESYDYAIVSIGNPRTRFELSLQLQETGFKIPTLISKKAYVSDSAEIGIGCVIEPMAVVNPNTVIESFCLISAGAIINHNSTVCQCSHIDCGAIILSNTIVEKQTKVPCGTVYKN